MTRSHGRAVGTYILLKYIRNQELSKCVFCGFVITIGFAFIQNDSNVQRRLSYHSSYFSESFLLVIRSTILR